MIEVNESSSVFIRVDDDNTFLWRALITGGGWGGANSLLVNSLDSAVNSFW